MTIKPTTFILGAGASLPYGYPSGNALVAEIIKALENSDSLAYQAAISAGISSDAILKFRTDLALMELNSIDAFLGIRKDYVDLGKISITGVLLPLERPQLYRETVNSEPSWYRYIWNFIYNRIDDVNVGPLSFLTYNYDRSLDWYLYSKFKELYGFGFSEMKNLGARIKIHHIHGILGSSPWDDESAREYSPNIGVDDILGAASGIKVIHEAAEIMAAYEIVHDVLSKSANVIFLGFGYNKDNVERLSTKVWWDNSELVIGSSIGILNGEQQRINGIFGGKLNVNNMALSGIEFIRLIDGRIWA